MFSEENTVSQNYTIYGMKKCTKTQEMKKMLETNRMGYSYVDVSEDEDASFLLKENNITEVPALFNGQHFIAGLDDLNALW